MLFFSQAEPSSITAAIPGEAGLVIGAFFEHEKTLPHFEPIIARIIARLFEDFLIIDYDCKQKTSRQTLTRQFKYSHLYLQTFLQHIIFLANGFCQVIPNVLKFDDV